MGVRPIGSSSSYLYNLLRVPWPKLSDLMDEIITLAVARRLAGQEIVLPDPLGNLVRSRADVSDRVLEEIGRLASVGTWIRVGQQLAPTSHAPDISSGKAQATANREEGKGNVFSQRG